MISARAVALEGVGLGARQIALRGLAPVVPISLPARFATLDYASTVFARTTFVPARMISEHVDSTATSTRLEIDVEALGEEHETTLTWMEDESVTHFTVVETLLP